MLQELKVLGSPVPIPENVSVREGGAADFSFSVEGSLVYMSAADSTLVWVDREGRALPVTETPRPFYNPRFSSEGQRLAVTVPGAEGCNIGIYEIVRGIFTPFTFEGSNQFPVWTPDGKRLTFSSDRSGPWDIFWKSVDASGETEALNANPPNVPIPTSCSPDGRWIAFTSNQSGRDEIYVKRYPAEGGITSISTDGGSQPVWARNGKELFYRSEGRVMVVSLQTEPTFQAETPRLLFQDLTCTTPLDRQPITTSLLMASTL